MKFEPKYEGLFQDWEIAVAMNLVNEFRETRSCLHREGSDDLLQVCLTHWSFVKTNYDPSREASPQTFMGGVIRNKLKDLVRERQADKRKMAHLARSLDEPIGNHEEPLTLVESITDTRPAPLLQIELKIDFSAVLQKLTPRQKKLCDLLGESGLNVKEASEYLNTPRPTIYDEIERIRKIFEKEGLKDYLK